MNINKSQLKRLSKDTKAVQSSLKMDFPIKVLQIGEGNFLRGFFDWMIHECNKQGHFRGSIAVTQPRPAGKGKIEEVKRQYGLYTLMLRGFHQGEKVESTEIISVFSKAIDPYEEWIEFLALSENPELEFVVSNTTEAGIKYQPIPLEEGKPMESFPGKLTAFLYHRYLHFNGDAKKGLIMLPCELLERNGDSLKQCVLKHGRDWELPKSFIDWVDRDNLFLNSLVDRIVTGFPANESEKLFAAWGYKDTLLNTAEPYHLWAIEGDPSMDQRLPLRKSGLNVRWVKDLTPYQMRKVRILNGSHTLLAPLGILSGLEEVKQAIDHPEFNQFLSNAIEKEIIPSLPFDQNEMKLYGESVLERFKNPFVHHLLTDISLNSISKFKVRLLPTLEEYQRSKGTLPDCIVRGFSGLIRFYRVNEMKGTYLGKSFAGKDYVVRDDIKTIEFFSEQWLNYERGQIPLRQLIEATLSNQYLWGKDLSGIPNLGNELCQYLEGMID
ncbi:tagaturonate reductase [Peribacillus frigoritolerans]|uniref:tagaturonate reductase n=1 Tax=Peribacillus frigoritolerans TaxID=450367 RepID=UPI0020402444|nr:tagaturonate reductase [Peribacillus frigoritolerans]MCM3166783.1 tagaturonate reductase [Peribacillus frigoritolerans]